MAFGMKHWMGLTAVGLVLVMIWRLPPSFIEITEREFHVPEVTRADHLLDEVRRTHEVLKHTRWGDSLAALTIATAVDGLAVGFPENHPPEAGAGGPNLRWTVDIAEEAKEEFRAQIAQELASLSPRSDVAAGYYYQLSNHGRVPGIDFVDAQQTLMYTGERDGQGYCIQVKSDSYLTDRDLTYWVRYAQDPETPYSGPCRLYLMYGMPGEQVGRWMEDGAITFALSATPPPDEEWDAYVGQIARRSYFGLNLYSFGFRGQSIEVDRCMAGYADGCQAAVADVRVMSTATEFQQYVTANSPLSWMSRNSWLSPFGSIDDYLLADLEREFGPEAFSRFWLSEEDVPAAFEAAFGMSMGEWVLSWVDGQMRISPPGPKMPKSAAMGGLLAMMLCAILAGAWARRRKVA